MPVTELRPPEMKIEAIGLKPVFFLLGPIQGAPDWQDEASSLIEERVTTDVVVANPRTDDYRSYSQQVRWEQHHIRRAKMLGGLIFWWPSETEDCPSPNAPDRAYAQTTRIEFGKVTGWLDYDPDIIVAMGIEDGYSGSEKYFKYEAAQHDIPIMPTLPQTVSYALDRIEDLHGPV